MVIRRPLSLAFLSAIALVGAGLRASADAPRALELTWQAPPECPDAASVERDVARLLGESPRAREGLAARAVVSRTEGTWRLVLVTERGGARGQRTLEARSCGALAQAAAVVLALTIDPTRGGAADAEGPATPELDAAPAEDASDAPEDAPYDVVEAASLEATPAVASRADEPVDAGPGAATHVSFPFAVSAGGAAIAGALPGLAFGPGGQAAWLPGAYRIELAIAYFPRARAFVAADKGGEFSLSRGGVRTCRSWGGRAWEVGPCLGIDVGAIAGSGIGVRLPESGVAPWIAATAGARVAWRTAGSFWLFAALEADVALVRYRFALDSLGLVHQPAAVGGSAVAGCELRFGQRDLP